MNERDSLIVKMFNEGKSEREIADSVKMSKSGVHKVLSNYIGKTTLPKKPSVNIKLTGDEERFTNFSGWVRTDVNTYSNKDTGEIVNLVYVPSKTVEDYGYFVKVKI